LKDKLSAMCFVFLYTSGLTLNKSYILKSDKTVCVSSDEGETLK
jgi:hypothetical protein